MYKHRQRRDIAKKQKSVVNADSEKGGNKRPMNICREVKDPPREQALEPTDDEVLPLKIHFTLEKSGILRESVNYRKQEHNTITTQREITCYDVEKEAYDPRFWTFFHADWYCSVYQSKKKYVVNMQLTDCDFMQKEKNNCLALAEVMAAHEHHGIEDVMELKYDWNDEVILQFYSTLYLDKKSNKLFWMIEDEIYSVSFVRFAAILGLQDHKRYPKKLHDDRVMELNWMCFMYEKDEYKLSKVEGFKPFLCCISFCERLCLQGKVIHLGSPGMKETSYMQSVKKKDSMCSTSFFRKFGMWLSLTIGHVPMHHIS
jgi:hypothetical protein